MRSIMCQKSSNIESRDTLSMLLALVIYLDLQFNRDTSRDTIVASAGGIMSMMMEQMTRVAVQRSMEEQTPKVPPASERVRDALPRVVVTKDCIIDTDNMDEYGCHDGVYRLFFNLEEISLDLCSFPQVFPNLHLASIGKLLLPCHVPTIKHSHAMKSQIF